MYIVRAAICAAPFSLLARFAGVALLGLFVSTQVAAQDITLTSRDGAVELSGRFVGFDGEYYRIDTPYGELTVDGSGVLCDGPGCPSLEDYVARLSVSGASSMAEILMPALVEGFALHEGYGIRRETLDSTQFEYVLTDTKSGRDIGRFRFRMTNSDEGFADLLANEADIAMSLREIRPDELRRARDAGFGDLRSRGRFRVLALDALVPVVSMTLPIDRIATADLARIFAGEITNWSAVGGPDAPITPYLRNGSSGLAQATIDKLMQPLGLELADTIERLDTDISLALAVSADPFGIGLASFAHTGGARRLALSGACGLAVARQSG